MPMNELPLSVVILGLLANSVGNIDLDIDAALESKQDHLEVFWQTFQQSDISNALIGGEGVTIILPSKKIFDANNIQTDLSEYLLSNQHDVLVDWMSYHVLPGRYKVSEMHNSDESLATLNGLAIEVSSSESGDTLINGYRVVEENISLNGHVIHTIDGVLTPGYIDPG